MDAHSINDITREALYVLIAVSAPALLISAAIGIIVSLFQALTQIQETTLTFVPKILILYISLFLIFPYMFSKLQIFTDHIMQYIIQV